MLRIPFEKSMAMSNIKKGFEKYGIHPFNPNAIDKSWSGTNGAAVDLSISNLISQTSTTHGDSGVFAFPDLTQGDGKLNNSFCD